MAVTVNKRRVLIVALWALEKEQKTAQRQLHNRQPSKQQLRRPMLDWWDWGHPHRGRVAGETLKRLGTHTRREDLEMIVFLIRTVGRSPRSAENKAERQSDKQQNSCFRTNEAVSAVTYIVSGPIKASAWWNEHLGGLLLINLSFRD